MSIPENSPVGAFVGTVVATDQDINYTLVTTDPLTYTIMSVIPPPRTQENTD